MDAMIEQKEMTKSQAELKLMKNDVASFMVHMTRHVENYGDARNNLQNILNTKKIFAFNCKGMFFNLKDYWLETKSVCFTEVPLTHIKYCLGMPGRDIKFEPYGLVFTREYLQSRGANPVMYLNTYQSDEIKQAITELINHPELRSSVEKIITYFDTFGKDGGDKNYDFYWEREWRFRGDMGFDYPDVLLGICRDEDIEFFNEKYPIKFISPFMNVEEIIKSLSQRK